MKRGVMPLRLAALRVLFQRFTFLGLVALSVALIVLGKAETVLVERARMAVADAFVPILDALARPVATVQAVSDRVFELVDVYTENQRLREENDRLLRWQTVAHKLDVENRSLRDTMRLVPDAPVSFVSARVVADAGGTFVRSVLVVAGSADGVAKGQTAVTGEGLVGRVSEVGERSARVLLLTDLNSQVPVLLETSRDRGILAGDNSDAPRLIHLTSDARPQVGERIVTSGHGGVFPPGLPVGVIVAVGEAGVRVKPVVQFHRLDHIRLVDYGLSGMLPVAAPPPPSRRGR